MSSLEIIAQKKNWQHIQMETHKKNIKLYLFPYFASFMREERDICTVNTFAVIKVITKDKKWAQTEWKLMTRCECELKKKFTGEGNSDRISWFRECIVAVVVFIFFQFSNGKMKFNWNMMLNKRKRPSIEP